jgi:hypothetical protein
MNLRNVFVSEVVHRLSAARIAFSVFLIALTAMFSAVPAFANNFSTSGWVSGFTVATSVVTSNDGGIVVTATWTHSSAELTDDPNSATPSSGVLDLGNRGPMFCDSAAVVNPALSNPAAVNGCMASGWPSTPAPIDVLTTTGAQNTITTTWTIPASNVANFNASYPFFGLRYAWKDSTGAVYWIYSPMVSIGQSIAVASGTATPAKSAVYEGPEIQGAIASTPIVAGELLTFSGRKLDVISSATIGSLAASLSYDATTGLTIGTPAGLAPGRYDLVMQSSYGKLTHINAVTIKAPTPTQTIGFKGEGEYLNETQVAQLVEFNSSLNADYEKVRCIVNAADAAVAKAIAVRVCAHVARGEARNVEVIQDVRSTYQGSGFWVRVYAKG